MWQQAKQSPVTLELMRSKKTKEILTISNSNKVYEENKGGAME